MSGIERKITLEKIGVWNETFLMKNKLSLIITAVITLHGKLNTRLWFHG